METSSFTLATCKWSDLGWLPSIQSVFLLTKNGEFGLVFERNWRLVRWWCPSVLVVGFCREFILGSLSFIVQAVTSPRDSWWTSVDEGIAARLFLGMFTFGKMNINRILSVNAKQNPKRIEDQEPWVHIRWCEVFVSLCLCVDKWVGRLAFGLLFKKDFTRNFKALLLARRAQARFLVYLCILCGVKHWHYQFVSFVHIFNHKNMASFGHNQLLGPVAGCISCCTYVLLPNKCSASVSALGADPMADFLQAFSKNGNVYEISFDKILHPQRLT